MKFLSVLIKVPLLFLLLNVLLTPNGYSLKTDTIPDVLHTPVSDAPNSAIYLVTNQVCTCYIDGGKGEQLSPAGPVKKMLPQGTYLIKAITPDNRVWQKVITLDQPSKKIINVLFESPLFPAANHYTQVRCWHWVGTPIFPRYRVDTHT